MHKPNSNSPSISRVQFNTACWHYNLALYFYGKYQECLNDDGLYHPNDIPKVKTALSRFRYHTQVADGITGRLPFKVSRKVRKYKPDTRQFADDFELALIQRGEQAKKAAQLPAFPLDKHFN